MANGDFADLPGAGQPLDLRDEVLVPPEQAMAYRILRNSGFIPQEIAERREIAAARKAVEGAASGCERVAAVKRLRALEARLGERTSTSPVSASAYRGKLLQKLAR